MNQAPFFCENHCIGIDAKLSITIAEYGVKTSFSSWERRASARQRFFDLATNMSRRCQAESTRAQPFPVLEKLTNFGVSGGHTFYAKKFSNAPCKKHVLVFSGPRDTKDGVSCIVPSHVRYRRQCKQTHSSKTGLIHAPRSLLIGWQASRL